ncbi:hypothetical protein N7528_010227 [Penicillium herquei]|nr:hypothetical protein N7528_010227 [Penicillium herquei]
MAIAYKRGEIIRLLLKDGRFEFNFTSLGIAARAVYDDMVTMHLAKQHRTRTAIADAARGARISTLRILLRDGRLNSNMSDKIGWRAIHYAAQYGSVEMFNLLLSVESIHIDAKYGDHTPCSEAARRGNIRAMQILIETRKVNIHSIDSSLWTPFHHAVDAGNIGGVRFLISQGVHPDKHNDNFPSPFALAAKYGDLDMMKVLYETGMVNLENPGEDDRTPLSYAAEGNSPEVVQFLLDLGVKPDPKDSNGRTPLSYAAEQCNGVVVHILLATGKVDMNSEDLHGWTPLHWTLQVIDKDLFSYHERYKDLVFEKLSGTWIRPLPWHTCPEKWLLCCWSAGWVEEPPHMLWDPESVFEHLIEYDGSVLKLKSMKGSIALTLWLVSKSMKWRPSWAIRRETCEALCGEGV